MARSISNRAFELCVAAALLAGCGWAQPPLVLPAALAQAQLRSGTKALAMPRLTLALRSLGYKATAPLLDTINTGKFDVTVYRAKSKDPAPLATISEGLDVPFGACIDGEGTLYVTNEPPSAGWVSEYPLGKTVPSRIITDGMREPAFCTIDAG